MKIHSLKATFVAAAALAFVPARAGAQIAPSTEIVLTTSTGTVAASSTGASVTSQSFSPNSLTGFAVMPNLTLATGGTAAVTLYFAPSLDGSNYATISPLSYAFAVSGTGSNVGFYNFPSNVSGSGNSTNVPWWRLQSIANTGTSAVTINSITITKTNR